MKKNDILKNIANHASDIQCFGVKKIGLFGSFLKGKNSKNSDVDIIVEFKKGCETFDNYFDLKFYLENLFKRHVDLVVHNTLKPAIKKRVINEVKYALI